MSDNHFHCWFIPGETYDTTATRYYLGYMLDSNANVSTNTQIAFAGSALPNSADDWIELVGGKGHSIKKTLKLLLMSCMLTAESGYVINTGERQTIAGVEYIVIWFESANDITTVDGSYTQITFEDGSTNYVAPIPIVREPGTNMFRMFLFEGTVRSGAAQLSPTPILPAEELWLESRLATMADTYGAVGLLLVQFGQRVIASDTVPIPYCSKYYRARISGAIIKARFCEDPGLCYDLNIEGALYVPSTTTQDTAMAYTVPSAPANVAAGANTYTDAILITWEAVTGASRYQVYVSSTSTEPTLVEEQTLDHGLYQGDTQTNGLLAEMVAYQWVDDHAVTFAPLGVVHGAEVGTGNRNNAKGLVDANTEKYPASKTAIAEESHFWYWVRARVGASGSDEWTVLSTPAHGVTKKTTTS